MGENVCRECHSVVKGQTCMVCGSTSLSSDWSGYVVILDIRDERGELKSEIAKKLNISKPGAYALKVR